MRIGQRVTLESVIMFQTAFARAQFQAATVGARSWHEVGQARPRVPSTSCSGRGCFLLRSSFWSMHAYQGLDGSMMFYA